MIPHNKMAEPLLVRKMRGMVCWHAVVVRLGYKKLKEEYSKWFMEVSGDTATKNVAL